MKEKQITNNIVMIRPANFGFNTETAGNNSFQSNDGSLTAGQISSKAQEEFDNFVAKLRKHDINVTVFEDTKEPYTPDAVFPNNWFSTHADGLVISYPMYAPVRRLERRSDIIQSIGENFEIERDYTFEHYEEEDIYLEGTGSLILDRENKIVYAALSPRTDISILDKWSILMNYKKVNFTAVDKNKEEIYHTNVMMALGIDFAVICLDSIANPAERNEVKKILTNSNKTIIDISYDQMESFAGNMLQVQSNNGSTYLVMSSAALGSLSADQISLIESKTQILTGEIPTIEKYGGGSVRCMIAENFLPSKKK